MFSVNDVTATLLAGFASMVTGMVWWMSRLALLRRAQKRAPHQDATVDRREELERARQYRAGRSQKAGALLIFFSIAIWPMGLILDATIQYVHPGPSHGIIGGTIATGVTVASWSLWRRGHQLLVRISDLELSSSQRPKILYLRPFLVDRLDHASRPARPEMFPKTNVERIERALRPVGPFVALGDPTDRLPPFGTIPVYSGDENWQEKVQEMTRQAGTIILPTYLIQDDSSAFAWEVEHVIRLGQPERIIFMLTPLTALSVPVLKKRYAVFRDRFGHLFPRELPEDIGKSTFLYFQSDWTPHLLSYRDPPKINVPPGSSGEQRALVLRRLHVACGHPMEYAVSDMLAKRTVSLTRFR